jgi:hypothetical protein
MDNASRKLSTRTCNGHSSDVADRLVDPTDAWCLTTAEIGMRRWASKLILYPRLDIKGGQYTEYMLPRTTNIRRVYVDDSKNPGTLWIGSNHGASIVKVEPLE